MWPYTSQNILNDSVQQALPQQPLSFGALSSPQPQMPQVPSPDTQPAQPAIGNRILNNPQLLNALGRMGSAISMANSQGASFGGSFGAGTAAFQDEMVRQKAEAQKQQQVDSETVLRQAQTAKSVSDANKGPFAGDGFENQVANSRYQYYLSQGMPDLEARNRAAKDVFDRQGGLTRDASGNIINIPGRTLPGLGQMSDQSPQAAPAAAPMPVPSVNADGNGQMLLPPPVAGQSGDMGMFNAAAPAPSAPSAPAGMTPNAQNAFNNTVAENEAKKQANGGMMPINATEGQAASRATLLAQGLAGLNQVMLSPNVSGLRMATADTATQAGPLGNYAAGLIRNPDEQRFASARDASLEALASTVTGAGVTADQFTRFTNMLPSGYEDASVRKDKLKNAYDYLSQQTNLTGPLRQQLQGQIQQMFAEKAPSKQGLPQGVTEEDIQHTMKLHNVSRADVLKKLGL